MGIRTDLASECEKIEENEIYFCEENGKFKYYFTEIKDAEKFQKPKGKYVTLAFDDIEKITDFLPLEKYFFKGMKNLIKKSEKVLVVGLGNREITADSIGPKTAEKLLATRHIMGDFAKKIGLENLKSVSVLVPNVLGKTGIEVQEILEGIISKIKPETVIVIDALCAKNSDRLFKTIQLCDSGIAPGSGVKNSRKELSKNTLNTNVIAIGVPTVIEYENESGNLIVTPKECDILTDKISDILARFLNIFLQPEIEPKILMELV